jgi:hypothetical protein
VAWSSGLWSRRFSQLLQKAPQLCGGHCRSGLPWDLIKFLAPKWIALSTGLVHVWERGAHVPSPSLCLSIYLSAPKRATSLDPRYGPSGIRRNSSRTGGESPQSIKQQPYPDQQFGGLQIRLRPSSSSHLLNFRDSPSAQRSPRNEVRARVVPICQLRAGATSALL